jgi:hypothetical protein
MASNEERMRLKPYDVAAIGVILVFGVLLARRGEGPTASDSLPASARPAPAPTPPGGREGLLRDLHETEEEARRLEVRLAELRRALEEVAPPPPTDPLSDPAVRDKWTRYIEYDQASSRILRAHLRRLDLEKLDLQLSLTADQRRAVGEILERRDDRILAFADEASAEGETGEERRARKEIRELLRPDQRPGLDKDEGDPRTWWDESGFDYRAKSLGLTAEQREGLKTPLYEADVEFEKARQDLERQMWRGIIPYEEYRVGLEKVAERCIDKVRDRMTTAQLTKFRELFRLY